MPFDGEPLFDPGDELVRHGEDQYTIAEFVARGGSGEVYRLSSDLHGSNRVVKIFLPFYFLDRVRRLGLLKSSTPDLTRQIFEHFEGLQISKREYAILAELNHPFVARVHDLVRVELPRTALNRLHEQYDLPDEARAVFGIIATYVDGRPLLDFTRDADADEVFEALLGVARALDYLNLERDVLHCDVKTENVLIQRADGLPVLVDFGLAEDPREEADRRISIDSSLVPSDPPTSKAKEIRRRLAEAEPVGRAAFREAFHPWLDAYQFGRLIEAVASGGSRLRSSERAFLEDLGALLQDTSWLLAHRDQGIASLVERTNANRVYPIVRTGAREGDLHVPSPNRRINIPPPLVELAQHPALVRLNRQNQLSLLSARFPGATHSRFLHSLDTYRLARALSRRLLDRPGFRTRMGESDVTFLLVAALYHDVNHVPLLHVFQELSDKSWLPDAFEIAAAYTSWSAETLAEALDRVGLSLDQLGVAVGARSPESLGRTLTDAEHITLSIVSGGVDVDKLSYLQLDSRFSGLNFAAIDVDALFESADVGIVDEGPSSGTPVLCFREEGLGSVEAVVRARTDGFERLYWCEENRAMMAAVLDVIRSLVGAGSDGTAALAAIVEESVGSSDYALLERLDRCAVDHGLTKSPLASFFDGSWGEMLVAGRREDADLAGRMLSLPADRRVQAEKELRDSVISRFGADDRAHVVLVDIPHRQLTFGGEIHVRRRNGGVVPATEWDEFRRYRERLQALSRTVSIFMDRVLVDSIASVGADPATVAFDTLASSLKDSWS